jgi:hypothetical protein
MDNRDNAKIIRKPQVKQEEPVEESENVVAPPEKNYCAVCNTKCDPICAEARRKRGILVCDELISYLDANPRMRPKKKRFDRRERDDEDQFE